MSWQIYRLTHSAMALGLVGLVEVVPVVGLMLPAGQLADRFSRRRVTLLALAVTCLCALCLTVLSVEAVPLSSGGTLGAINRCLEHLSRSMGEQGVSIVSPLVPVMYLVLLVLGTGR